MKGEYNMATIPSEKEILVREATEELINDIFELIEGIFNFHMVKSKDTELMKIWYEIVNESKSFGYKRNCFKKEFIDKVYERLVKII